MDRASAALEQLRQMSTDARLASLCGELGIDLLVVFGSTVAPNPLRPPEDLDLAVLFDSASASTVLAVVDAFTRTLDFGDVDVLDLGRADIVAVDQALSIGELLYEREPGLHARRQMTAAGRRMDTAWLRRLSLELMAS